MTTTTETVNPAIAALAQELRPLIDNAPARPTQADRDALMAVRDKIKNFDRDGLDATAQRDIAGLYVMSTQLANKQEDFWENNGEKWAE